MWESTPRRWPHILGCTLQDGPSGRSLSVGGILMRGTSSRSQRHPSHILTSHFHLYTPAMPMLLGKDDRRYISYWKSRGPTQPHPTPPTSLILSFIPFRRSIRMTHADNQYLHVQWTLWWWLISTATKGFLYFWIYPMTSTFNPHESLSNGHCPCPLSSPSSSIAVVFMIYVSMVQTLFTLFPELTEWSVSWLFHHIIKELTFHDIVKVTFAAPQILLKFRFCWKSKHQEDASHQPWGALLHLWHLLSGVDS